MTRPALHWLLGGTLCLLCCELMLQLLPVSSATQTDYYLAPRVLSYPPGHVWTTATGWDLRNVQRHRANNAGFLARRDFVVDPNAVALIGDSFVESSMLAPADRPDAQLERGLASRPVYAFGGPGSALLDYAERVRLASERYGVRDFVILMERGDVAQSLCGSGNIHGPCLDRQTLEPAEERKPSAGMAKRLLRHSALMQYLFAQLKLDPVRLWHALRVPQGKDASMPAGRDGPGGSPGIDFRRIPDAVGKAFFDRIRGAVAGRLVIVVDADRVALEAGRQPHDPARRHFMALARAAGAVVIDAEPLFQAHLKDSVLKLEVGPYDAHLNPVGVRILMDAAAGALQSTPVTRNAEGPNR